MLSARQDVGTLYGVPTFCLALRPLNLQNPIVCTT